MDQLKVSNESNGMVGLSTFHSEYTSVMALIVLLLFFPIFFKSLSIYQGEKWEYLLIKALKANESVYIENGTYQFC